MKKIIITSLNPAKIHAVQSAFSAVFKNNTFEYIGVSISSEVSDQPMSEYETKSGALNRVKNAKRQYPNCDFYVGLEAGFEHNSIFAWMIIETNLSNQRGESRSASLLLPTEVIKQLHQGLELGDVIDSLFNTTNIKQKGGTISILTDGLLTRSSVYQQALILALAPFLHQDLFNL